MLEISICANHKLSHPFPAPFAAAINSYEAVHTTSGGDIVLGQGAEYSAALEGLGVGPRSRDLLPNKETKFQVRVTAIPLAV